jgi:hypothetical protein
MSYFYFGNRIGVRLVGNLHRVCGMVWSHLNTYLIYGKSRSEFNAFRHHL